GQQRLDDREDLLGARRVPRGRRDADQRLELPLRPRGDLLGAGGDPAHAARPYTEAAPPGVSARLPVQLAVALGHGLVVALSREAPGRLVEPVVGEPLLVQARLLLVELGL